MRDRISAGLILTLGLCLATLTFLMWAIGATAITAGPLHRDAAGLLEQSPVHQTMANEVAAAIATQVPTGSAVDPLVLADVGEPDTRSNPRSSPRSAPRSIRSRTMRCAAR